MAGRGGGGATGPVFTIEASVPVVSIYKPLKSFESARKEEERTFTTGDGMRGSLGLDNQTLISTNEVATVPSVSSRSFSNLASVDSSPRTLAFNAAIIFSF